MRLNVPTPTKVRAGGSGMAAAVDAARAQKRPQRHLERTGVGARHDRDEKVLRQSEERLRALDGELEDRLALFRPVRAADECGAEGIGRPAGVLGARSRREAGIGRTQCRLLRSSHVSPLPDSCSSVGRSVPPRGLVALMMDVNTSGQESPAHPRGQNRWPALQRMTTAPPAAERASCHCVSCWRGPGGGLVFPGSPCRPR